MKKWRCTVCGYIHEGDTPPDVCPVCGVGPELFELMEDSGMNPSGEKKAPAKDVEISVGKSDPQAMKSAIFKISYGMYIVTSAKGDKINGQAANTVFQVTSEPLRIAVGINKSNLTHEFIQDSGNIGITILGEDDHGLIRNFGYSSGRDRDKFESMDYVKTAAGIPLLKDGIAFLEGRIIREKSIDVGTHTLFLVDVTDGALIEDREPMTYAYFRKTK